MIHLLRADNPGPMTLTGTNSYVITALGAAIVVDPGPVDPEHLARLEACAGSDLGLVLLTHHHADHTAAAVALADRSGCHVRALDPAMCNGAAPLADGERLAVGDTSLTVVATPGHTADSLCLLVRDESEGTVVLTGDTVLGSGSSVIAAPDGNLADYLDSLDRVAALVARFAATALLPGHGPRIDDPADRIAAYRDHRLERLDQVRAALRAGAATAEDVVDFVYADIDPSVRFAAIQSAQAQVDYLRHQSG